MGGGGGAAEDQQRAPPHTDKQEREQRPPASSPVPADEGLTPWEQHSSVISIPRFDYRAASSLLRRSHSGFLITCPIKREKSATKEAISILEEHISSKHRNRSEAQSNTNGAAKKRKLHFKETNGGFIGNAESKDTNDSSIVSLESDRNAETSVLSLVKLTKSGLLLFTFTNNSLHCTVRTLSKILQSLGSGTQKPPLWCHRIFPIQETCILIEEDLQRVVSKLIQEYLCSEDNHLERPIKFAVGFNRRGIDETRVKSSNTNTENSKGSTLLDRDRCFQVVAGAVKAVATNSSVDLKSPELVVLVEWLPLSGVPHGSPVVGVSILPSDLIITKPRLCVKPLVSDAKATKKSS